METQNTLDSQDLPKQLSDAAWNSILPFLRDCRNVYVGNPETCRHFLSAVLWIAKEGATSGFTESLWQLECDLPSRDGAMRVFFKPLNIFMMRAPSQVSSLACGHMPRQRGPPKKRRTRGTSTRTNSLYDETLSLSDACIPILIAGHRNDISCAD